MRLCVVLGLIGRDHRIFHFLRRRKRRSSYEDEEYEEEEEEDILISMYQQQPAASSQQLFILFLYDFVFYIPSSRERRRLSGPLLCSATMIERR